MGYNIISENVFTVIETTNLCNDVTAMNLYTLENGLSYYYIIKTKQKRIKTTCWNKKAHF